METLFRYLKILTKSTLVSHLWNLVYAILLLKPGCSLADHGCQDCSLLVSCLLKLGVIVPEWHGRKYQFSVKHSTPGMLGQIG